MEHQTALQTFTDQVMAILIPAFVAAIGLLVTWLLLMLKQKLHIDVSVKTQEAWAELAKNAALRGAEWARARTKEIVTDYKIPGGDTMDVAFRWALQMAEQQGLPALARDKLVGLIESELFKLRREDAATTVGVPPLGPAAPIEPVKPTEAVTPAMGSPSRLRSDTGGSI